MSNKKRYHDSHTCTVLTISCFLADVFEHFEKGGEFFCFSGQSNQAITGIYNLNRASQLMFPGEKILKDAKVFSYRFLRQKQANNQLLDKWIITKDLPGEVKCALVKRKRVCAFAFEVSKWYYISLPLVCGAFRIRNEEHISWTIHFVVLQINHSRCTK